MAANSGNRREFIRIPFNTEVIIDAGDSVIRSKKGLNVSMNGIHLSSVASILAPGTSCHVALHLQGVEDGVKIEASGKIIRSAPNDLAIEFTDLDLDSYQHLRLLILNNTDEPEKAEKEFYAHWGIRRPAF